jgi:uncharacterized spore protein YtfJ
MSNSAQEILDTILGRLKTLATSETVIGQPVKAGEMTLLPVVKVSIGFAAGAGEGSGGESKGVGKGAGAGGGGGGGASITPVGFIVLDGNDVRFVPTGKGTIDTILDSIPGIISKFGVNKKNQKTEQASPKDGDEA